MGIEYWILIGLLIIAIVMSMCVSCRVYVPYAELVFGEPEGFENSETAPTAADIDESAELDIFSKAEGSRDCPPTSGLTNSMGNLCLDEKMTALLTSRGGNATGKPATM